MGALFSKPKQETGSSIKNANTETVKAFYIVGSKKERSEKLNELINANPQLTHCFSDSDETCFASALQLSNKPFFAGFDAVKASAEAARARGENSVFMLSLPLPDRKYPYGTNKSHELRSCDYDHRNDYAKFGR